MARHRPAEKTPACFALVHPGLEEIAEEEITRDLQGEVRKSSSGLVAFRLDEITGDILKLRTTEDVFLLAWGSDSLTSRPSVDLDQIQEWTRKAPWDQLLRIHHTIRAKPKGKPTYRIVTQMAGEHGYRRSDAGDAFRAGLTGVFPQSWKPAQENASIEVWLRIAGKQAVSGIRLSDRTMRHRHYKEEHLPASLRPTVAAAMARLAGTSPDEVVLDPMCGTGTILAEQMELANHRKLQRITLWGGDLESTAVRAASANLKRFSPSLLSRWDARQLPLASDCVDRILCNPPFGRQLGEPGEIAELYRDLVQEFDRVMKPGGRIVLLVGHPGPMLEAVSAVGWRSVRQLRLKMLGLSAFLGVWRKDDPSGTIH